LRPAGRWSIDEDFCGQGSVVPDAAVGGVTWRKKTQAQMQKESGNRLEIREIGSNALLQELGFR
jgi:hypothetical protein